MHLLFIINAFTLLMNIITEIYIYNLMTTWHFYIMIKFNTLYIDIPNYLFDSNG